MANNKKLISCFIITETKHGIECAKLALDRDIIILGFFSDHPKVSKWASEKNIKCYPPKKQILKKILHYTQYDYLFSIINTIVLDKEIIECANIASINYHDALLPESAGLYATFWAVFKGKKKHGITWHLIDEGIDTGDILVQTSFPLSDSETTFSLDVKCYQACIKTFSILLNQIETNKLSPQKQNFSKRTYHSLYERPDHVGVYNWNDSLKKFDMLYRSCRFGGENNPFFKPKIIVKSKCYILEDVNVSLLSIFNKYKNGEIIEKNKKHIKVSAPDGVLSIKKIKDIKGNPVSLEQFAIDNAIGENFVFKTLSNNFLQGLNNLYHKSIKSENYWVRKLINIEVHDFPLQKESTTKESSYHKILNPDDSLIFLVFLAFFTGNKLFDIGLLSDIPEEFCTVFSELIFFRVKIDFNKDINFNVNGITKNIEKSKKQNWYANDLFQRYENIKYKTVSFPFILDRERSLKYNSAFYSNGDIQNLIKRFRVFLKNFKKSEKTIPTLLLDDHEYKLISEFNDTNDDFSSLDTIKYQEGKAYNFYFEQAVKKYSNKTALKLADKTFSYHEFDCKSSQAAHYLLDKGVKKGDLVGVVADSSPESIISIISILKAGAAYVPIDANYPEQRISYIIKNSKPKLIIKSDLTVSADNIKGVGVDIIEYNMLEKLSESFPVSIPKITVSENDTVYVMYTSGTTGKPKGTIITHKNLLNHNLFAIKEYKITSSDKIMQFGSLSFDLSVEEVFPGFLVGAQLVMAPLKVRLTLEGFHEFLINNEITFIDLPTAFWHSVVASINTMPLSKTVKTVIIGGERASKSKFNIWKEKTKGIRLINTYGPTETTVVASTGEDLSNIGNPVSNNKIFIMNKAGYILPPGFKGELCISGKSVSAGYLDNPAETSKQFVNFPMDDRSKLYKTGDLALISDSKELEFCGRIDNQVKVRGFRIELDEIKSVIENVKGVEQAIIKTLNNKIAVYYTEGNEGFNEKELYAAIDAKLPNYMKPNRCLKIKAIPLTFNGKVDYSALANPFQTEHFIPPQTAIQEMLCNIFKRVLKIDNVGINDNFISLGGESISALQVISCLKNASLNLTVENLMNSANIIEMSKKISRDDFEFARERHFTSTVVELNRCHSETAPLFLFHSTPGDILGYVNFIALLPKERAIYGVESLGLKSRSKLHQNFQEMVKYYVEEIKVIKPHGPYLLGGWCYGGLIAYEVACILKAEGENVPFVGLIESWGRPSGIAKVVCCFNILKNNY